SLRRFDGAALCIVYPISFVCTVRLPAGRSCPVEDAHRTDEDVMSSLSHFRRHQTANASAKRSRYTSGLRRYLANRGERDSVASSGSGFRQRPNLAAGDDLAGGVSPVVGVDVAELVAVV